MAPGNYTVEAKSLYNNVVWETETIKRDANDNKSAKETC